MKEDLFALVAQYDDECEILGVYNKKTIDRLSSLTNEKYSVEKVRLNSHLKEIEKGVISWNFDLNLDGTVYYGEPRPVFYEKEYIKFGFGFSGLVFECSVKAASPESAIDIAKERAFPMFTDGSALAYVDKAIESERSMLEAMKNIQGASWRIPPPMGSLEKLIKYRDQLEIAINELS